MNRWDTLPPFLTADMAKQMVNGFYRSDEIKRMENEIYGAKVFGIKEDTKMNDAQGAKNKQDADKNRRAIMNKLKVGDKICTSSNTTTPMEIFAFDYQHLRIGLKHRISGEGYEKVSQFWIDPLIIVYPDVRNKVSYTNYYKPPNRIPTPKRIIISKKSKVTVVLWDDGTKTIVRCSEADTYDVYAAYCAAFAKKCYGTNSQLKKTIEKLTVYQEKETGGLPTLEEFAESMRKFSKTFGKVISEEP